MASGQQVAFQPALAQMLAQHLDDAALEREMVITWHRRRDPLALPGRLQPNPGFIGIDSESALAAGLLFGSPEFQRR